MTEYTAEFSTPLALELVELPPRGLRAGVLLAVASILLAPFAALPPYAATVILGFGGTLAVFLCILFKYRGRIPLNLETCFHAGTSVQFLLMPALLRVITDNFTAIYWRETADRVYIKAFYPQAMLIAIVFLAAVLLGAGFFKVPVGSKLVAGRIASIFSRRTWIILVFMIANVWSARATLLANGAFYHVGVGRGTFAQSDAYSGLIQVSTGLGAMVVAYVWTAVFAVRAPLLFAIVYTFFDTAWAFIGGFREPIVQNAIIIALSYYVCRNRVPWKFIFLSAVPLMILVGFMQSFRYSAKKMEADRIDIGAVVSALRDQGSSDSGGAPFFLIGIAPSTASIRSRQSRPGRRNPSRF